MIKKVLFVSMIMCLLPIISEGVEVEKNHENPLANITNNPGFVGIFHKWGFIGDSLCSGEHEYVKPDGTKGYHDMYDYSWGQRMCALTGTKGDNYSKGGETTKGWIEHFWDNPRNGNNNIDAKASPKQAYIIALGCNDSNPKHPIVCGNADTDIDTLDYRNNAQTFSGYYGGIIQRVRSIAPDSKIFVVTMPNKKGSPYNESIRKMAKIYKSTYVIDLEKYAPEYDAAFKKRYYLHGHLNAMGYEYTAWMMLTYINWIIEHNWEDFIQAGFIGTPYKG